MSVLANKIKSNLTDYYTSHSRFNVKPSSVEVYGGDLVDLGDCLTFDIRIVFSRGNRLRYIYRGGVSLGYTHMAEDIQRIFDSLLDQQLEGEG